MFENELQQLGLSEKEAKVYLASLELGSTSVLEISKKAGLKRPTTYYAIEELIKKGLMSSFEKGKKRYFSAESPERLISLVSVQRRKAQALEEDLQKVLPELNKFFNLAGERPKVRFFEGKEGMRTIQEDILKSKFNSMEEFVPIDPGYRLFPPHHRDHRHKILEIHKKVPMRAIYTSKKGPILPAKEANLIRRFVPPEKFPFTADILIYGNKTALITFVGKIIGVIIESEGIAQTLRTFFNLAWEGAKNYQG